MQVAPSRDTYAISKATGDAEIIGALAHRLYFQITPDGEKTGHWLIKDEIGKARKFRARVMSVSGCTKKHSSFIFIADAANIKHAQEIMQTKLKNDPRNLVAIGYE